MRRSFAFGAFAAAALLTLTVPSSAYAAQGTLRVNGTAYVNPSGCYIVMPPAQLDIDNQTNGDVFVFADGTCNGDYTGVVRAGERSDFYDGASFGIR